MILHNFPALCGCDATRLQPQGEASGGVGPEWRRWMLREAGSCRAGKQPDIEKIDVLAGTSATGLSRLTRGKPDAMSEPVICIPDRVPNPVVSCVISGRDRLARKPGLADPVRITPFDAAKPAAWRQPFGQVASRATEMASGAGCCICPAEGEPHAVLAAAVYSVSHPSVLAPRPS